MRCSDVDKLVHPYVDGELVADDCVLVERHAAECERCRALLAFQTSFKASVRARLRARTQTVEAPERLRSAIRDALDRADAHGDGPVARPWRRALPAGAALLAAAGVALFLGLRTQPADADSALVEDAIRGHEKHLPAEVGGPDISDDAIRAWMRGKVAVPVRPPQVNYPTVSLVGARVYHLRNRDAGQIFYRVGRSQMSVYVFDPSGWRLRAPVKEVVGRHNVYVSQERGYTVAVYEDRGVGYAFASDLGRDEMLRVVAASLGDK